MPRIIAVANQKGGSGKTTTAVNLADTLAEQERSVLLVDMDAQANATRWMDINTGNVDNTIYDVLTDNYDVTDVIRGTDVMGVDIVPSSSWMLQLEDKLSGEIGREMMLRDALNSVSGYDYIIIDCSPALGIGTINALTAASEVLVPVEAAAMALTGLSQLVQTIRKVREKLNSDLDVAGLLACRVDRRTIHAEEIVDHLRERFGERVFRTIIRENVRVKESYSFQQPITAYDSSSAGAEDYRSLAKEIISQERHEPEEQTEDRTNGVR